MNRADYEGRRTPYRDPAPFLSSQLVRDQSVFLAGAVALLVLDALGGLSVVFSALLASDEEVLALSSFFPVGMPVDDFPLLSVT